MIRDRDILDTISTGILVLDDALAVVSLNAAGEALLRSSAARSRGLHAGQLILHPAEWELDEEVPLGAPAVYRNLRRWLSGMGIELGRQPAAASEDPAA